MTKNLLFYFYLLLYLIYYYLYLTQMKILRFHLPELSEGMSQSISDRWKAFHSTFIFTGRLLWPVWSRSASKVTPCLTIDLDARKIFLLNSTGETPNLLFNYTRWAWTSILIFTHRNKHSGIADDATFLGLVMQYHGNLMQEKLI